MEIVDWRFEWTSLPLKVQVAIDTDEGDYSIELMMAVEAIGGGDRGSREEGCMSL